MFTENYKKKYCKLRPENYQKSIKQLMSRPKIKVDSASWKARVTIVVWLRKFITQLFALSTRIENYNSLDSARRQFFFDKVYEMSDHSMFCNPRKLRNKEFMWANCVLMIHSLLLQHRRNRGKYYAMIVIPITCLILCSIIVWILISRQEKNLANQLQMAM